MAMRLKYTEEIIEDGGVYIVETYESDKTGKMSVVKKLKPTYVEPEPVEPEPTQLDRIEENVNKLVTETTVTDVLLGVE